MVSATETIEVASVGGRAPRILSRQMLCRDIIQPRIEEIFSFVKAEIMRLGCEDMLASGAVITGAPLSSRHGGTGGGGAGHPGAAGHAQRRRGPGRRGQRSPRFPPASGLVQ